MTVTTALTGAPEQVFADAVIEYVVVPLLIPSTLVRVSLIVVPEPVPPPLVLELVAVQLKAAPATGELNASDVEEPLQIVWVAGVTTIVGIGLTVTLTVAGGDVHPFAVAVTLYTTVPGVAPVAVSV